MSPSKRTDGQRSGADVQAAQGCCGGDGTEDVGEGWQKLGNRHCAATQMVGVTAMAPAENGGQRDGGRRSWL